MASFRVGQRVRIKFAGDPAMVGLEATVTGLGDYGFPADPPYQNVRHDCMIKLDCDHRDWFAATDALEPIQPEGWKVVEWSACLWQPEWVAA